MTVYGKSGKLPADIPVAANKIYKDAGWAGMGDWLGTGNVAPQLRKFRSFKPARKFARSLKLKSNIEWRAFSKSGKLPGDIPSDPYRVYADHWISWPDWLGYD